MITAYNFIASWQLFPEKGSYENGNRPKSGIYKIESAEAKKQLLKAVDMVDDTTEWADVYEHLGFVSEALNDHEEAQGY